MRGEDAPARNSFVTPAAAHGPVALSWIQPRKAPRVGTHGMLTPIGARAKTPTWTQVGDRARKASPREIIFPRKITFPLCHVFPGLTQANPSTMVPKKEHCQGQQLAPAQPGQRQHNHSSPGWHFLHFPAGHMLFPGTPSACQHTPTLACPTPLPGEAQHPHGAREVLGEMPRFPYAWVKIHHDNTDA